MNQTAHSHVTDKAAEACPYCGHEITHDELVAIEQRIQQETQERFVARERQLNVQHMAEKSELHKKMAAKDDVSKARLTAEQDKHEKALAEKDRVAEKQAEAARAAERAKIEKDRLDEKEMLANERKVLEAERKKIADEEVARKKENQAALDKQRDVLNDNFEKKRLADLADSDRKNIRLQQKLEEAQRQLENKSNEELGDGAEVQLYNDLKVAFPDDVITRVKKGVAGADIKHEVHVDGRFCGKFVYDSKNRNDWKTAYAEQLRKDQLAEEADHAILATRKFPTKEREMTGRNGVYLVNPARAVVLAGFLREALVRLSTVKMSEQGKKDKQTKLYEFITSANCANLFQRVADEVENLRKLDVKEKTQQEKMRSNRAKHVAEVEKTVLGTFQNQLNKILGV